MSGGGLTIFVLQAGRRPVARSTLPSSCRHCEYQGAHDAVYEPVDQGTNDDGATAWIEKGLLLEGKKMGSHDGPPLAIRVG
ncbi:hypothetical protein EJB05_57591, partial [Eragrostis curvula]